MSGLDALRSAHFDCVLLDFRLPDGDAMDVLKAARAAEGECPPFIIQTVLDHEDTAVGTLGQGAQDYLVKGQFDAALLRRTIRYAIERDRLIKERNRLQTRVAGSLDAHQDPRGAAADLQLLQKHPGQGRRLAPRRRLYRRSQQDGHQPWDLPGLHAKALSLVYPVIVP
jgi:DNA-binding response OmpR family regulator